MRWHNSAYDFFFEYEQRHAQNAGHERHERGKRQLRSHPAKHRNSFRGRRARQDSQDSSAAQILLAWEDSERLHQGLRHAKFTAAKLTAVRKRGWAESINERDEGVCSISAPIRNASGQVIAAISISGPNGRMGANPGRRYAPLVMAAGKYLTDALIKASSGR